MLCFIVYFQLKNGHDLQTDNEVIVLVYSLPIFLSLLTPPTLPPYSLRPMSFMACVHENKSDRSGQ